MNESEKNTKYRVPLTAMETWIRDTLCITVTKEPSPSNLLLYLIRCQLQALEDDVFDVVVHRVDVDITIFLESTVDGGVDFTYPIRGVKQRR